MSFRCSRCKNAFPSSERPVRLVTGYRIVTLEHGETHRQITGEQDVCGACAHVLEPTNEEVIRRTKDQARRLALAASSKPSTEISRSEN